MGGRINAWRHAADNGHAALAELLGDLPRGALAIGGTLACTHHGQMLAHQGMKIPTVKQKPWWRGKLPQRPGKTRVIPIQQGNLCLLHGYQTPMHVFPLRFLKQHSALPLGQSASS